MAQITWKNINNPNFTGGNNLIEGANRTLLSGVDQLASLASTLEGNQRSSQTASVLDQINALDNSGLETALANGEFKGLGNVDTSAISKALRGQGKVITDREDAKFGRDELLSNRREAPIITQLKNAIASGQGNIEDIQNSGIRDKSGLINALQGKTRSDLLATRQEEVYQAKQLDIEQRNTGETTIQDSLARLKSDIAGGASFESVRNNLADTLAQQGNDPREVNALMDQFAKDRERKRNLSTGSLERLDQTMALYDDEQDQTRNQLQRTHSALKAASPPRVALDTQGKAEAMADIHQFIDKNLGSEGWFNFGGGRQAGQDLKEIVNELAKEEGTEPWMIDAAIKATKESASDTDNPEVFTDEMRELIADLKVNAGKGGQIRKTRLQESQTALDLFDKNALKSRQQKQRTSETNLRKSLKIQ